MEPIVVTQTAQINEQTELEPGDKIIIERRISNDVKRIIDVLRDAGFEVKTENMVNTAEPQAVVEVEGKRIVLTFEELGANFFFAGEYTAAM